MIWFIIGARTALLALALVSSAITAHNIRVGSLDYGGTWLFGLWWALFWLLGEIPIS